MKRISTSISALCLCFLLSCGSKHAGSKLSDAAQKNLDATHKITDCIQMADFSKIGDYIAATAVDHEGENGDVNGVDSIKASLTGMCRKMDMKSEVVKEFADEDYVFSWQKKSGAMKVDYMGMPSGTKFTFNAIDVSRFKDGKAIEHWVFVLPSDMMKMMSAGSGSKPDSTKKM